MLSVLTPVSLRWTESRHHDRNCGTYRGTMEGSEREKGSRENCRRELNNILEYILLCTICSRNYVYSGPLALKCVCAVHFVSVSQFRPSLCVQFMQRQRWIRQSAPKGRLFRKVWTLNCKCLNLWGLIHVFSSRWQWWQWPIQGSKTRSWCGIAN